MTKSLLSKISWKKVLCNVLGSAILAFGLCNIHEFSNVTEGGILGMTLLLHHFLDISPAVSGFIMNGICYLIGFKVLGWAFIAYSIIAGCSFSAFYAFFEQFAPAFPRITEMPFAAALSGAVFVGIGAGLCVRTNGAPSGDDALVMSICKATRWNIRTAYLLCDLFVLALSMTYLDTSRIFYSLLTVILSGHIISLMQK